MDLTQCLSTATPPAPGTVRGGLRIAAYRILPDNTLMFADQHVTLDRDGKPIIQFIRYEVKPDESVIFTMTIMDLPDYARRKVQVGFRCRLGGGLKFFKAGG
ncbi:VirK family protein [Azorhizobium doebereinerae]|uniref:VirK family protein n=1 Tax=Azorhizobium doebereinerae TaxID=281091 RepID=UPI0018DCD951|nr:VirK family protein [Azorhizobium doebereinerae]